ncbi:MAG: cyclic nucleotide-binding domain-containing protein [Fibrobacter sp.]|nr:cyclic nucleotide-binding domain-containing protein [Fibrobacter sp.]
MKPVDSRQQTIPPVRSNVKAGFVVYTPDCEERSIVILNDGELVARKKDGPGAFSNDIVFTMHPGDLVGVASLLEGETFKHTLVASKDSSITLVTEECMESELKRLPLWLLAVIRSLSSKTRLLKQETHQTRVQNTIKSLAQFCSGKPANTKFNLAALIMEFNWLTRIPTSTIQLDFKGLFRRKLVHLSMENGKVFCKIKDPSLLEIFVDYQNTQEKDSDFEPYKLSDSQKKVLSLLSTVNADLCEESHYWLAFIQKHYPKADVAEWIMLQKLGWFKQAGQNLFTVDTNKVAYFLKALEFETNIRGVL